MGKKSNIITTVAFLIIGIIGVLPQITGGQKYIEENFGKEYVFLILTIFLFVIFSAILILPPIIVSKIIDLLKPFISRKNISVNILKESKLHLGGVLFFEVNYTANLNNGYFHTHIRSPFVNEKDDLYEYYDEYTKKDDRKGDYKNRIFNYKWNIPTNFTHGDFKIYIELLDVFTWFGIRKQFHLKMQELTIKIEEKPQKQIISIHKITNPKLKTLDNINLNTKLPLVGWICIKLQNINDYDITDCFGKIITDMGEYPIYDYELFVKNNEKPNLDDYMIFSIDRNSTKRLYAKIESNITTITSKMDFGKEEINQELSLITSSSDIH